MTVRQSPTLSPRGGSADAPWKARLDSGALRALVISDTHFGAWTGRDLLREEFFLERLAPALDGIDEVILLGDLFDFLFGSVADSVDASAGLLALIAEKLRGRRFVFLAGNHDHHLVHRDEESRLEAALARGDAPRVDGARRRPRRPAPPSSRPSSKSACPGSRSRSPTRPTAAPASSARTATTSTRTPGWPARGARGC